MGVLVLAGWSMVGLRFVRIGGIRNLCPSVSWAGGQVADFHRRRTLSQVVAYEQGTVLSHTRQQNYGRPVQRIGRVIHSAQTATLVARTIHREAGKRKF